MSSLSNSSHSTTLTKINTSILKWPLNIISVFIISLMTPMVSLSASSNKNNVTPPININVIAPQFTLIKAGTFLMGSPENEPTRYHQAETQHSVTLTRNFEIQTTEVTQMQWVTVMGYNPSRFQGKGFCP